MAVPKEIGVITQGGAMDTTTKPGQISTGAGFAIIGVFIVGFIVKCNMESDEPAKSAQEIATDACRDDYKRCSDNTMLVNNWSGMYEVTRACKDASDQRAKYGHPTFSDVPFGHYVTGKDYVTKGVVLITDQGAEFQNGFGAMAKAVVHCLYDIKSHSVTDLEIVPVE